MSILIVWCSCPTTHTAEIAQQLINAQVAACVSVLPAMQSYYQWNNTLQTAEEQLLMIKTSTLIYPALEKLLMEIHPYEVPEIIAHAISQGLPAYLDWVQQTTKPS